MKTFLLAQDHKEKYKAIPPRMAKIISGEDFVESAFSMREESFWVAPGLEALTSAFEDLDEIFFKRQNELRRRVKLCILADNIPLQFRRALDTLFGGAVVLSRSSSLPVEQIVEALSGKHPERYVIGGQIDEVTRTLTLVRGDLSSLIVPLSTFRPSGSGISPDFSAFGVDDFGQTIRFGEYEASVDSVLYEYDPNCRKEVKKELARKGKTFGTCLRRLRIQKGLRQTDFPNIDAREIGRIERGEVKPRKSTIRKLSKTLGVSPDDIKSY